MTTTHPHAPVGHIAAAVMVGVLVAGQSRINGDLGIVVGDGVTAAVLSFLVGLVFLLFVVFLRSNGRAATKRIIDAVRSRRTRPWELMGGLFGALLVAQQGGIVPIIGVALFSVALVGGGTAGSLLVDRIGIGPAGRRAVTTARVISALLATVGVAIAATSDSAADGVAPLTVAILVGVVAITGALAALQGALNGRIAVTSGDSFVATLINFVVGLIALVVAWFVWHAPRGFEGIGMPPAPWENPVIWTGGLIGVAFVAVTSIVVKTLGVLLLGLANVFGQIVGAMTLDLLVPVGDARITLSLIVGALVTVVAVLIGTMRPRSSSGGSSPRKVSV
jgi:bacterial/archaeal transporter family-2 protein